MNKIRVLIVEDSAVIREYLRHIIGQDPRLEVAAAAASAEEALTMIRSAAPDVVSMDIRLPGMNGFEATRRIMSEWPLPIVVVSASVEDEDLKITMNALRAGALTVVEKPVGATHHDYERMAAHLCNQLAIMSKVKVVRQRMNGKPPAFRARPAAAVAAEKRARSAFRFCAEPHMVGIVASTGGPNALVQLLNGLSPGLPLPILVVQHISPGFLAGFVSWLGGTCSFPVAVARDGELPAPGGVYVAPDSRHLRVEGGRLRCDDGPPVSLQCPSGTVLLRSMAGLGPHGVGIVLTGMGDDGAEGLLEMRRAGAYTIAEAQSTAAVYGMPDAAVRLGAVCESLPLHAIAGRVQELVRESGLEETAPNL